MKALKEKNRVNQKCIKKYIFEYNAVFYSDDIRIPWMLNDDEILLKTKSMCRVVSI